MQNENFPSTPVIGGYVVAGIFALGGFAYLRNRFFTRPSANEVYQKQLNLKLKACTEQFDSHAEDKLEIYAGLKACKQEIIDNTNEFKYKLGSSHYYQAVERCSTKENSSETETLIQLSYNLLKMLGSYPPFPEKDQLNLESISIFLEENGKHHEEVLELAKTYIPETYHALSESRRIESTNDLDKTRSIL